MEHHTGNHESTSFCSLQFFDCFSTRSSDNAQQAGAYPSRLTKSATSITLTSPVIKRETNVLDQQPHLIEPMTLRVYDDLPATPLLPEPSHLSQWGRNLASRASSRASRLSMKRKITSKSVISRPQLVQQASNDLPLRRRQGFTPLQLSIYVEDNRLSDLPEFDRLSFTEVGELKAPPKALVRTQSEDILRTRQKLVIEPPKRTMSMFEAGDINFVRPNTSHSITSVSRPPSEYDALHSHPVSWASLPGIPVSQSQKPDHYISVLTPMKEEFSPVSPTVTVSGTVLAFPRAAVLESANTSCQLPLLAESQAPYPSISQGPSGLTSGSSQNSLRTSSRNSRQTQKRISQWLQYRTNSSSTSTVGSTSTTSSFSEHRRKRSDFYKLAQQPQVSTTEAPITPASPPKPLNFSKALPVAPIKPVHQRTDTTSTAQTVDTSVLSSDFDDADYGSKRLSQESMTTYTASDVKSRAGTVKSVRSPTFPLIVTPTCQDMGFGLAMSSPYTGEILEPHDALYLSEINGPLRSPGVGIAF